jgi:hypothetical protein
MAARDDAVNLALGGASSTQTTSDLDRLYSMGDGELAVLIAQHRGELS